MLLRRELIFPHARDEDNGPLVDLLGRSRVLMTLDTYSGRGQLLPTSADVLDSMVGSDKLGE